MKNITRISLLMTTLLGASWAMATPKVPAAPVTAAADTADHSNEQALMERVRSFYNWALKNGTQVSQLQPKIRDIPKSKKFALDTHNLKAFTGKFIASGNFAPEFSNAVENYYAKYQKDFAAYTDAEFAQMAKDGRGPLMDTEDMDIFFCAQEYEYKKSYINKMQPKAVKVEGDRASLTVVSGDQWETEFKFVKINTQWLIAGYCVFK